MFLNLMNSHSTKSHRRASKNLKCDEFIWTNMVKSKLVFVLWDELKSVLRLYLQRRTRPSERVRHILRRVSGNSNDRKGILFIYKIKAFDKSFLRYHKKRQQSRYRSPSIIVGVTFRTPPQ